MPDKLVLKVQKIGFQWEMENPFIFCAHHLDAFPKGNSDGGPIVPLRGRNIGSDFSNKDGFSMYHGDVVPGFPAHPHRGFETVTIVLEGLVDHFDSKGAKGRYGNGDVQWLTTGKGCQHAEMFPLVNQDKPNPLELFQVWLNLPKKDKFTEPSYKMLWAEDIPVIKQTNAQGGIISIRLISGSVGSINSLDPNSASWAANRENHVGIQLITMDPHTQMILPKVSSTLVRNLYYYRGDDSIKIDSDLIPSSNRIKLSGNHDIIIENNNKIAYMILLEAEPISEPVFQYGPFVMNTRDEVVKAYQDFQATEFGGWPWDRRDPINPLNAGRFAMYANGSVEKR